MKKTRDEHETKISYKEAMKIASPLWKKMKEEYEPKIAGRYATMLGGLLNPEYFEEEVKRGKEEGPEGFPFGPFFLPGGLCGFTASPVRGTG